MLTTTTSAFPAAVPPDCKHVPPLDLCLLVEDAPLNACPADSISAPPDCQHIPPLDLCSLRANHFFVLQIPSQQVLVVHDDLDLPTGKVRLRAKGGHGGHNGMRSIVQHLQGSQDFPRLKIGIGRPAGQLPVAAFVLQASHCQTLAANYFELCESLQSDVPE